MRGHADVGKPDCSLGPVDAKGFQTYNVRTPAGYPSLAPSNASLFLGVVDGVTHLFKDNTGELSALVDVILNPDGNLNCDSTRSALRYRWGT